MEGRTNWELDSIVAGKTTVKRGSGHWCDDVPGRQTAWVRNEWRSYLAFGPL